MKHLNNIKVILFDAANTLIYKPDLYDKIINVLKIYGFNINRKELITRHKILSEIINFPDRTSKEFYNFFNSELLIILGIIPREEILDSLFVECSYLPWKVFEDVIYLKDIKVKKAVLSNFNSSLEKLLQDLIGENLFSEMIVSEKEKVRKPDLDFYQLALNKLGVLPSEILYIGDSLKLDIIPAQKLGINTLIIDRDNLYTNSINRISNFKEILDII